MTSRFNLSDWALEHRSLVWYFMIVSAIAGVLAYINLGREEDPSFTIKTMVIAAQWPGATVEDTTRQVTDRIEKKLEELELARLHPQPNHAGPDRHLCPPEGHDQESRRAGRLGESSEHDQRRQKGVAPRRRGPVLR